jgi:nucleotide-binding universal stress UspA family protein
MGEVAIARILVGLDGSVSQELIHRARVPVTMVPNTDDL